MTGIRHDGISQPRGEVRLNPLADLAAYGARLRDLLTQGAPWAKLDFEPLALELFGHQFVANPVYRRFSESQGLTPERISNWTQIPAVPTSAFKEVDLTALPPAERATVFHSSGTTKQRPSRHYHNAASLALYEAALTAWFSPHFLGDFRLTSSLVLESDASQPPLSLRFFSLTPPPSAAPHSSLVHMVAHVAGQFGASESQFFGRVGSDGSWHLEVDALETRLREAEETNRPVALLGTAFSFVHWLDHLASRGRTHRLPRGSRVMETGGYKGRSRTLTRAELHGSLTRASGIPATHIVCEYGMSELSSQAYRTIHPAAGAANPTAPLFRFPPWTRIAAISPETGRPVPTAMPGLLRVFDLANVWSVLAVQTEDLVIIHEPDSGGFELLGRAPRAEARGCSLMPAG